MFRRRKDQPDKPARTREPDDDNAHREDGSGGLPPGQSAPAHTAPGFPDEGFQDQGFRDERFQDQGFQDERFQDQGFQVPPYEVPEYSPPPYTGPALHAPHTPEETRDPGRGQRGHRYQDGHPETSWHEASPNYGARHAGEPFPPVQGQGPAAGRDPGHPASGPSRPEVTRPPSGAADPGPPPYAPGVSRPGDRGPAGALPPRPAGPPAVRGSSVPSATARRIEVGTPAAFVEPKPPPADPYRPDTIFDGWSTPHLTLRLASVRGDAHRSDGTPRQDDVVVAWHQPTGAVVFAVADGVSASPLSHVGAALVCRTAVNDLLAQLADGRQEPDWSRVLQASAYQLFMRAAHGREPDERDREAAVRTLSTTLVTGMAEPTASGEVTVTLARAGDSSAWCLRGTDFAELLYDEEPDTGDISSSAVVALPRISARSGARRYLLPRDAVLLVGTDGFGVPLGDGTGQVGELFAKGLATPPAEPSALAHLLNFSRETFDDDRTLLAVWSRHAPAGGNGPRRPALPPGGAR